MEGKTETLMFILITLTASHHSWPSFHWSRLVSLNCCIIWFLWSTPKKPSLTGLTDVILSSSTVCLSISKVILHFYWWSLYLRVCTSVIQVIYLLTHSFRSLDWALQVVLKSWSWSLKETGFCGQGPLGFGMTCPRKLGWQHQIIF